MGKSLIFCIISLFSLMTCTNTWTARPIGIPDYEQCPAFKGGPHMLKIPGYELSYMITEHCDIVPREKVSIALSIFLQERAKMYGLNDAMAIEKSVQEIVITFGQKKKRVRAYDHGGNLVENAMATGLAYGPTSIWVQIKRHQLLCESSLVHELVHSAIWTIKKTDGDPDHLGSLFSGWTPKEDMLIDRVNKRLCKLGI